MNRSYAKLAAALLGLACSGAQAATIAVSTLADEFGAGSACSLREAVQSANTNADFGGCTHSGTYGTDLITLSQGFYTLSRGDFSSFTDIDEDDNALIDIDIRSNLTIQGVGAGIVSIGNTSGDYRGRIFHVVAGTVTITGVTLRDGENPNGRFGGGLRSNSGTTVTLNAVRVFGNTADGGAGGILNEGTMTLNGCLVDSNDTTNAFDGGGGVYNNTGATMTLNDSRVLNNTTRGTGAGGNGAGVYNQNGGTLTLDNTTVDGNVIDIRGTVATKVNGDGGGVFSNGAFTIRQSTISNNVAAGNDASGGGIHCNNTTNSLIETSLIKGNRAQANPDAYSDAPSAGGISGCGGLVIRDSVIDGNSADEIGGGVAFFATLINSTISNNHAANAGGILATGGAVVNSTIVGNQADRDGGGVISNDGKFYNTTIVANTSNADGVFGGAGGGLVVRAGDTTTLVNSVIAGNLENGIGNHDDCDGVVVSLGHNLIQNSSGCSLSGGGGTDLVDINAQLAALADNGGPPVGASTATVFGAMLTRAPASGSPLIDRGDPSGCRDGANALLATDQVGNPRTVDGPDPDAIATCDIGAVEVPALIDAIFANGFE